MLPRIPQEFKKLIDDKIEHKGEVLTVHWTGSEFHLKSSQGKILVNESQTWSMKVKH